MPRIAIVILNWNGMLFLQQFLPVLVKNTPSDMAEIIVADNHSSDNSVSWLSQNHPSIRIIQLEKNYGFAEGYNLAVQQCSNELILMLNSDVEVSANWLSPLLTAMDNQNYAAVMPKILSHTDKQRFEYAGASGGFIDSYGYPFCRGRVFDSIETDNGQYNSTTEVFWTSGACMMVRRSVFIQAGGFDADFFAHMEEIDLCWRIQRLGLKLKVIPDSCVYHVGGGTLPNESSHKLFLNFRNNLFLLYKNLPDNKLLRIIISRLILDTVAAMMYLLKGQGQFFIAVFKAHLAFYKSLNNLKKKRLANPVERIQLTGMYKTSIVAAYFYHNKKKFTDLSE
ncbi:MAG: glycosyltransferase family 2 protein [Bacteroidales bacterium]|nr:glycosyltransferase family 2 protein [Bacteroidales bacterium]